MLKKVACAAALGVLFVAPTAYAQEHRVEAAFTLGWTFSDGVDSEPILAQNGNIYDRVDPKDSAKWGFDVGGIIGTNWQVGFMFSQQMTTLEASGPSVTTDIGDMSTNNYHGYFGYNFGESDATVRPYVIGGIGATHFGEVSYTRAITGPATIPGTTQLSTTWGAGVKAYPSPNVGVRVGAQWTPTYIKSDAGGWWCDPWWGCYVVGNAKYSNQLDFTGSIMFRF